MNVVNGDAIITRAKQLLRDLSVERVDGPKILAAFTHPSYKGIAPHEEDYERLEFLGDAVLDLVAAQALVEESGTASEGAMTERRKQYVSNEVLAHVFDHFKLATLIRAAVNYAPSLKDKADVVEALFGAVFLTPDNGYTACWHLWHAVRERMGFHRKTRVRAPQTAEEEANRTEYEFFYQSLGLTPKNAKSSLQELCQKQNLPLPSYDLLARAGPDHDPAFTVKITAKLFDRIPRLTYTAQATAKSKKLAELKAAEQLCEQIFLPYTPSS